MRFILLTPAVLVGCETSGLYSASALEQLYDVSPVPEDPAWEMRWLGQDVGLNLGCDLIPVGEFEAELIGGTVSAAPPSIGAPQLWNDEGQYRWAVALLVMVNPVQYNPAALDGEEDDEDYGFEEEEEFAELESVVGIWGGVENRALLFAQGDYEEIEESLVIGEESEIDDAFFASMENEGIWVGVVPELVSQLGTLAGAMYPLAEVEWEEMDDDGLYVTANERLSEMSYDMLSGESLGGVRWGCEQ